MRALKIRPGETQKVLLMAMYLLLAVATFIAGRIARDSLFLSAFDNEDLAYMYISVALLVPLPAYFYARIADRFRRDRLILWTLGFIIAGLLGCRLLLLTGERWVYVVLYNFVELMGTFLLLQFWTFATDLFSSREAKRLFPVIGTGAIVASIVCGVSISAVVKLVGTANLLFLQIAGILGCCLLVATLGRMERARLSEAIAQSNRQGGPREERFQVKNQVSNVFESKHLKIIAAMTVATFITVPLIDYQFKVLSKEAYTTAGNVDTDGLAAFMGLFSAITGVIAGCAQLGFASRILERFGVVVSLLILPLTLLIGMGGMLIGVASTFFCAIFTKGAENALRYSIYDATMQVIYTPVPSHVRGRAKTFIEGIVKPLAGGFAGAAIVAVVGPLRLPLTSLAAVAATLTMIWVVLILFIRSEYVAQLLATLRRRRLDFSQKSLVITDDPTVALLRRTLRSNNPAEVRNAIEIARRVQGHDLTSDIVALLRHQDPDLRVRALDTLARSTSTALAEQVRSLFSDADDDVKAAAVRTFCAILRAPALVVVKELLRSPVPGVRGAAVASLIKHGGPDGVLLGADHLTQMQRSPDETVRYAAVAVYRDIAVGGFFQPVLALMRDASPRVQNAAIAAAGAMCAPELIPALVYRLGKRETARAAASALACYGEPVVEILGKVLAQDREMQMLRTQVPRILERIGTSRCLEVLMQNLSVRDPSTRRETARSAARLRDRLHATVDNKRVRALIDEEIREHYQNLAALADMHAMEGDSGSSLLRDAIEELLTGSLDRIFRLLSIVYPRKTIELIFGNLASTLVTTRANAIEVLDNLLDSEEKKRLLPLLEDHGHESVVRHGAELYDLARKPPEDWIEGYLTGRDPWLVVVALYVTGELRLVRFAPIVAGHIRHPDAIVRETALRTLAMVVPARQFQDTCHTLEDDHDPVVRRTIEWLARQAALALPDSAALDAMTKPADPGSAPKGIVA